jgi:RNA polymerase-binding transcription factor DksA
MQKSKCSIRRIILVELFKHLKSCYDYELTPNSVKSVLNSNAGIDALLSFKSDSHLDDLHGALLRLEAGSFGVCIACKLSINQARLDNDVTTRLCPSCEAGFNSRWLAADILAAFPREVCPQKVPDTHRPEIMDGVHALRGLRIE